VGHDVGAAAAGIRLDGLAVADDDDAKQGDDPDRDGQRIGGGARAGEDEDEKDLLRGVGNRRDRVRGEDGERFDLGELLAFQAMAGQRGTKNAVTDAEVTPVQAAALLAALAAEAAASPSGRSSMRKRTTNGPWTGPRSWLTSQPRSTYLRMPATHRSAVGYCSSW